MKTWLKKLANQLDVDWGGSGEPAPVDIPDDKATLLFIIDAYQKNLIDMENHPVRKVRESLDEFTKLILKSKNADLEGVLFKFRQYFSAYRLDESSYIQKTFDEFKTIIWDFADQLSEDLADEKATDTHVGRNLDQLREAVESNSIEVLRSKAREFIDSYVEIHNHREEKRFKKLSRVKKNLQSVKKKLTEANNNMRLDHLTQAYNRKSFDEQLKSHYKLAEITKAPVSMIILDIDFFKKINDAYGHDIGDFVLKECVLLLKEVFNRKEDFVARIGGEEFTVLLPDTRAEEAIKRAEEAMNRIRREVFVQGPLEIRFTVSMGIAQLMANENPETWLKRADQALYHSKNSGRNKYTLADPKLKLESVA